MATFILRRLLFVAVVLFAAAGPGTSAFGEGLQQRRVALVIGNTNYQSVTPLKNGVRDSEAIAETLRTLGFEVTQASDVSLTQFQSALGAFYQASAGADASVFYYSGHGFQLSGINYLVPVDARLTDRSLIEAETIGLDEITRQTQNRRRPALIFLDACRNNPLPPALQAASGAEGLAQLETGSGTFIAFATQPGNITRDGSGEHSPFAAALLEHMPTPGISISDMMIRVRNSVEAATLHTQTPWDQSSLRSQFYFNRDGQAGVAVKAGDRGARQMLDQLREAFAIRSGLKLAGTANEATSDLATADPLVPGLRIESADEPSETTSQTAAAAPDPDLRPAGEDVSGAAAPNAAPPASSGAVGSVVPSLLPPEPSVASPSDLEASSVADAAIPVEGVSSYGPAAVIAAATDTLRVASESFRIDGSLDVPVAGSAVAENTVPARAEPDASISDVGATGAAKSDAYEVAALAAQEGLSATPEITLDRMLPAAFDGVRIVGEEVPAQPEADVIDPDAVDFAAINPREEARDPVEDPASAAQIGIEPAAVPADLPRAVQQELVRLGCFRSAVNGDWGSSSTRALLRYYAAKQVEPDVLEPGAELFVRLSAEESAICTPTASRLDVEPARGRAAGDLPAEP